jgi:hypothetical protein
LKKRQHKRGHSGEDGVKEGNKSQSSEESERCDVRAIKKPGRESDGLNTDVLDD